MRIVGGAVSILAVALAGCGGDDVQAADYVRANAEALEQVFGPAIDDEQAECLSEGIVDAIGVDQLRDLDVDPERLESEEGVEDLDLGTGDVDRERLVEAIDECGYAEVFVAGAVRSAGTAVGPDARGCLSDRLRDDPDFVEATVNDFIGAGDAERTAAVFADAVAGCPDVAAQVYIAGYVDASGEPLSPAAVTCITEQARSDPPAAAQLFAGLDQARAFDEHVRAACAGLLG